jgi:trk system potassium uptake protein TrkH
VKYLAVIMLVPLTVAAVYREDVWVFVVSIVVAVVVGTGLKRFDPDPDLGPREGLLMVSLSWLAVGVVGTVPYLLAGYGTESTVGLDLRPDAPMAVAAAALADSVVNALFESMSGVTTNGATVLGEISTDRHSQALLMWR